MTDAEFPPPPMHVPVAAARTPWWKRHWVHVTGALVVGAGIGGATAPGSLRSQNDSLRTELAAAKGRASAAEAKVAAPAPTHTVYVTPSAPAPAPPAPPKPTTAPPPPPPKPTPPPAPPAPTGLSDNGWQALSMKASCSYGDWTGTARIKNTNTDADTAIFTFTLFRKGVQVGTLQGSASDVETGRTVTVQLISTDACSSGAFTYEFQVDMSY